MSFVLQELNHVQTFLKLGAFQLLNLIQVQVLEMTWHGVSAHITAMGNNKEFKKQNRSIELSIKEPFKFKHGGEK